MNPVNVPTQIPATSRTTNDLVLIDGDNLICTTAVAAPSAHAFAIAVAERLEAVLGGRPRRCVFYVNPRTHPHALDAFVAAGMEVRATPSLLATGKASTDAALISEGWALAQTSKPARVVVVSCDTDFAHFLTHLRHLGHDTVLVAPRDAPRPLRAAAAVTLPLWAAGATIGGIVAAPEGPDAPAFLEPRPGAFAVRGDAQAPREIYKQVALRFYSHGFAFPALDGPRMRDLLALVPDALPAEDRCAALAREARARNLYVKPAEVGFTLFALRHAPEPVHDLMSTDEVVRAFTGGVLALANASGVRLLPDAEARLADWLAAPGNALAGARAAASLAEA